MTAPPVLKHGKFECSDSGLTVAGHKRAPLADITHALSGRVEKRTIKKKATEKVEKQPKSWWEAQVRLYGLECNKWTIGHMQAVLQTAVESGYLEVPEDLKKVEKMLNKIRVHWNNLDEMPIDDHDDGNDSVATPDPAAAMRRFCPTYLGNQTIEEWQKRREERAENARKRTLAKMNRDHALLLLSKPDGGDDIFGTWQIDCPGILDEWPDSDDIDKGMTWIIHPPVENDTHSWCFFNQMIVEGVMGIEWRTKKLEQKHWLNIKRPFSFRGLESGEYDFCCIDEGNKGWIKFSSAHECHGEFEVQFSSHAWEFTGKKVSLKRPGKRPVSLAKEYETLGRDFDKKTALW
jgi:hypothetical protein